MARPRIAIRFANGLQLSGFTVNQAGALPRAHPDSRSLILVKKRGGIPIGAIIVEFSYSSNGVVLGRNDCDATLGTNPNITQTIAVDRKKAVERQAIRFRKDPPLVVASIHSDDAMISGRQPIDSRFSFQNKSSLGKLVGILGDAWQIGYVGD